MVNAGEYLSDSGAVKKCADSGRLEDWLANLLQILL